MLGFLKGRRKQENETKPAEKEKPVEKEPEKLSEEQKRRFNFFRSSKPTAAAETPAATSITDQNANIDIEKTEGMALQNIHLATTKEDNDMYSGYNDDNPLLRTEDLYQDEGFQNAVRTSYGRRPPTSGRVSAGNSTRNSTASGYRSGRAITSGIGRPVTTSTDGFSRPMTAVRGAGYSSSATLRPGQSFDPLGQSRSPTSAPPLHTKSEDAPEIKVKELEKKIMQLIEESCFTASRGENKLALDKAKEAYNKEKTLIRQQEQAGLAEAHNIDLTFSVLFNMANQYLSNEMYTEALNTYQDIIKNRMYSNAGRLRVNIGNIYFKLGQYNKAIKFYRMALDQVPNMQKDMRIKIMHNIGLLFVKMGQYSDACSSYEFIMTEKPDFRTGLDLITCYYVLGDKEKMKQGFQRMLDCPLDIDDDDKYQPVNDDPHANLILEVIKNDTLRKIERQKIQEAERCIMSAAKLISPVIEETFTQGYDWCVEAIKGSFHSALANDLEINKAITYLRQRDMPQAIENLKAFEKKETKVASAAATNLSFVYYLQDDITMAEKYAEQARERDMYNSGALVNLGNCHYRKGDLEKARECFIAALDSDASCTEALYNLGLTQKKLGQLEEARLSFLKLQDILRNHPQVLYQIADLYEKQGDTDEAVNWYMQLLGLVPSDPHVLQKLGEIFDAEGDKQQAFQYHTESYRYFPSNLEVIDWLGSYFIEHGVSEKAISYLQRAALMQPDEPKWKLMIASCHRRSGNYQLALQTYRNIHQRFPNNIESLRFLARLTSDMGLKEAADYQQELKKAERQGSSGSGTGGPLGGSRSGSANSPLSSGRQTKISFADLEDAENSNLYMASPVGPRNLDTSYTDPLGPLAERPRTAARKRDDDEFGDEELGDDLLPV